MPKKTSPKTDKKASTKKLDTAILVALIALTGTLTTALMNSSVIVEWLKHRPQETEPASVSSISPAASTPVSSNSGSTSSGSDATCLMDYFSDVDASKLINIEVGVRAQDHEFPSADLELQGPVGPFGVKLTQNGQMIGAIHFLFFGDSELFKLTSVVDANCQPIVEYSNAHGGDNSSIENSGWLNLRLDDALFTLNFQRWGLNKFRFNFQQVQ